MTWLWAYESAPSREGWNALANSWLSLSIYSQAKLAAAPAPVPTLICLPGLIPVLRKHSCWQRGHQGERRQALTPVCAALPTLPPAHFALPRSAFPRESGSTRSGSQCSLYPTATTPPRMRRGHRYKVHVSLVATALSLSPPWAGIREETWQRQHPVAALSFSSRAVAQGGKMSRANRALSLNGMPSRTFAAGLECRTQSCRKKITCRK